VRRYVILWGVLLAALIGSLALGPYAGAPAVVALIFAIATAKALLVVSYYMHLAAEPRFLKLVMAGAMSAVAILFFGLYPDIVLKYGDFKPVVPSAVAEAAPATVHAGDPAAGETVYRTYCQACLQADGRGMNGTLAANFIEDKGRLVKPDAELLNSIRAGKTGAIGTMPPWGSTLSQQQQADVLAHIRHAYGSTP
jgi:caa(3)-type oxidase subunit IV